jgi:hypothetical protein
MIEIKQANGIEDDNMLRTVAEIVFASSDLVSADYHKFEKSNPAVAEMIWDRFAETVADYLALLKRNDDVVLKPLDYGLDGDLHVAFQFGEYDIDLAPSLGLVLTEGGRLSMRFTAPAEIMARLLGRRDNIQRCFDLLANARHVSFMRTEVPR